MRPHLLRLVVSVAPPYLGVVLWIRSHAQQVEAVQLVEHFDADTVPCFAGRRVGDAQGVEWFAQLGEVGCRDHLVGDCWCG